MKLCISGLVALVSAAGAFLGGVAAVGSQDEIPQAVREAILRAYPQATLGDSERGEVEVTVYEVEIQHGGTQLDVLVSADGTIILTDQDVARDALPKAVAETLDRLAGSAEVDEVERTERRAELAFVALPGTTVAYEAEWRRDGRRIGVTIDENGALADNGEDEEEEEEEEEEEKRR